MSISSSASDHKRTAVTGAKESSKVSLPITLSERSITGFALIRIFVGYLWFQQLFWKMPPDFAGLYSVHHTRITAYNHTRLWLYSSAYVSFWLYKFTYSRRLYLVCAIGCGCMDCRTDCGYFAYVRSFHTFRSNSWFDTRHPVICWVSLYGMDYGRMAC